MKVGLFITNQHPVAADMVAETEAQRVLLRHARDAGWDSYFASHHYLTGGAQKLQPVPALARFAAEAGEMTMGIGILLLALHNPVEVAETMASLDVISRGNFVFGVGQGYREAEFAAFGVPKGQRVQRFTEHLNVIRRLWAGESVHYERPWCRLDGARLNLRPVQRPHPPVWIAANSDAAVRRAARLSDTWFINPHATLATNARQLALFQAERAAGGLAPPAELPLVREIVCARDTATALAVAEPYLGAMYRGYVQWGQDKAMPGDESLQQSFAELVRDRFVVGSPEDCYAQLRPYVEELGVNHLVLRLHWAGMPLSTTLAGMRLISRELLPALRRLRPRVAVGAAPNASTEGRG